MKTWYKYIIALAILILAIIIPLIWVFRLELLTLLELAKTQAAILGKIHPIYLIAGIGILPAFGIPAAIFYVAGSIAYGVEWGLIYSGIGVAINISFAYWIANSFLRKWILAFLNKQGHKPLTIPKSEIKATIIAIRLMPGLPLCAQNYILGVSGVPFKAYFILSWPTQMFWAVFFILAANTVIKQTTESIILVVLGILVLLLLIKVFRGIAEKKYNNLDSE
ncbi:hypothetical protein AYO37_00470 [Opitutia bacterium SCGC AG-212-L18]|nr:hypothetical protein AYO37_00470 [Opitutae bacterium SCGC AG-212-L18]